MQSIEGLEPTKKHVEPPTKQQHEVLEFFNWVTEEVGRISKKENLFERFVLTSSAIEQVMLPSLMKFVAKHHKIELSSEIFERGNQGHQINWLYYGLSHDRKLFDLLEKSRKTRNEFIHRFYKSPKIKKGQEKYIRHAIANNRKVMIEIINRFEFKDGIHKDLPSLNLYALGWKDCKKQILETMNKKLQELKA